MRAVLDTNVIVSATLIRGKNEDKILRAWQGGAFELVLSPEILDEVGRVFSYEKLRKFRWMTEAETVTLLETLAEEAVLVPGITVVEASRDPSDNKFLAAAIEGQARYVVTGDRDLLDLKEFGGISVVTPGSFLKVLRRRRRRSSGRHQVREWRS